MTTDEQVRATLAAVERLADVLTKLATVVYEDLAAEAKRKQPY